MASTGQSVNKYDLNVKEDVPEFAMLFLPPFPPKGKAIEPLVPFSLWEQAGIAIPKLIHEGSAKGSSSSRANGQDAGTRPLVDMSQDHSVEARAIRQTERLTKRLAEGGELVRMRVEDCLKIGEENTDWVEPEGTANEARFDVNSTPFDRLIAAARDFQYSRNEEFQFHRSRRLFNIMRDSFGLRTERRGVHWQAGELATDLRPEGESCCLLRNTNSSVRGFLALARREAEAGWDIKPSFKLCQITAAYMSYVVHHLVLAEEPYASRFASAAAVARTAPRLLLDALRVEEALARRDGWHVTTWSLWGGQYGGVDRGGLHAEEWPVDDGLAQVEETYQGGDGSWHTAGGQLDHSAVKQDDAKDISRSTSAPTQVEPDMKQRLASLEVDGMRLLEYIPYARRLIIAVHSPTANHESESHLAGLCCFVTVSSPWSEDEGWRRMPTDINQEPSNDSAPDTEGVSPLDCEVGTIEEPTRLNIWIEQSVLGDDPSGKSLIGMALRGRWGLFGPSKTSNYQWWAFQSKDYVLPALWSGMDEKEMGQ